MAERLTKKIVKTIQDKYSLGSYLYYDFAEMDDTNKLLNKLGKLEDILEKYGIDSVEELEKRLQNLFELTCGRKNGKTIARKIILFDKMKQDRDTWKRACEFLAYKYAKEYFDGRDIEHCFNADKRDKFIKENINYFYQQAKTEGNYE